MKFLIIIACLFYAHVNAFYGSRIPKVPSFGTDEERIKKEISLGNSTLPQELYFAARVDHYNGSNWDTWQMRYLINDQYYNASQGPILFYTGNEGGIWGFYNNSGFIVDTLAKRYGALVVFAEHRYYGKSWPFGSATESFKTENLKYLTVPQVMRDFIDLVKKLKVDRPELENRATILNGGSYGGMLSAWMRMKYPNQFQGALAASAPILWFQGKTNPNIWSDIASHVVRKQGGQQCFDLYKDGLYDLHNVVYDASKWDEVQSIFSTCEAPETPEQVQTLIGTVYDGLQAMVQVNYPYETHFEAPLPAWPNTQACAAAKTFPPNEDLKLANRFNTTNIMAIQRAYDVFANYSGNVGCINFDGSPNGTVPDINPFGWDVQTCNDLPIELGDEPATSCFGWNTFDRYAWTDKCQTKYNLNPQYNWALDYFGGRDPAADFEGSSNIIFSNGNIDPWSGGGVLTNVTSNNIALIVEDGAHHYDLRGPSEHDTWSVKEVRAVEFATIKTWIEDFQNMVLWINWD